MSYLYVVNSKKATAVSFSARCSFTSADHINLILAKCNNIEVYTFGSDGLKFVKTLPLFGRVVGLQAFRPAGANKDVLFILIERKKYCIVEFDEEKQKIVTRAVGNLKERKGRDADLGQKCFLDPDCRVMGLQLYDSSIKILPLDRSQLMEHFNIILEESRILDMKFLYGCSRPTLCILYEDNRRGRHIKTVIIDIREKTQVAGPFHRDNVEFTAALLVPVPSPVNGVLVIGVNTISYIGIGGNVQTVEISPADPTAIARINIEGTRYLLGNIKGNLTVIALITDLSSHKVVGITTDMLGTTNIAETIEYLEYGMVFIGCSLGDSQLLKLHDQPVDLINGCIQVVDEYENIGPIMDMCVTGTTTQTENSSFANNNAQSTGQSTRQIVTCSGFDTCGTLRIIRSGIGLQEQASLEITGIKGIWSLRTHENSHYDKYLVQSFLGETRVLAMEDEELAEVEISSFSLNIPSLFVGNILGGLFVQVTPLSLRLVKLEVLVQELTFHKTITVATANLTQVVLTLSGGELIYLQLENGQLKVMKSVQLDQDIACLSLQPATTHSQVDNMEMKVDNTTAEAIGESPLVAVGMWTDHTIRLFSLPDLQELSRMTLDVGMTQARDIIFLQDSEANANSEGQLLFVGLGDGHLLTFNLESNASSGLPMLTNCRKGVLGTHPITFKAFFHGGEKCIFACGDRPTVIYLRHHKVLFSTLDTSSSSSSSSSYSSYSSSNSNGSSEEVVNVTPFHTELFPDCLALCSESALLIGTVEDIQKLHVKTIKLKESPRRITYSAYHGVYIVLTEKTELASSNAQDDNSGKEIIKSRVLFLDEVDFSIVGIFELELLEQGLSIAIVNGEEGQAPLIAVGTAQLIYEELEPSKGRILVFEVTPEKRYNLLAERETKAAVYCLAGIAGRIAAGNGHKVQIYKLLTRDDGSSVTGGAMSYSRGMVVSELQLECSIAEHILVIFLRIVPHAEHHYLIAGDLHRSITLLQYKPVEASIEEVARDFNTNMMRSLESLPALPEHFLGADDQMNLFMVKHRAAAETEEERAKLQQLAEYHLGDYVNVMQRGNLISQPINSSSSGGNYAAGGSASANAMVEDSNDPAVAVSSGGIDIFNAEYRSVTGFPVDTPGIIFGTVSGMIGSILALDEFSYQFFLAVQSAMRKVFRPVEGFAHEDWRVFQNDYRTGTVKNVIDGDLIEQLLDMDREELVAVTDEVNMELTTFMQNHASNNNANTASNSSISSESASALIAQLAVNKVRFTPEEIFRRVEDMARLH